MRTLYIECNMGAAGDMLMAAMYELLDEEQKQEFLDHMNGSGLPGVRITPRKSSTCGICGTHMEVTVYGEEEREPEEVHTGHHGHAHEELHDGHHGHHHADPLHITELIRGLDLPEEEYKDLLGILYRNYPEGVNERNSDGDTPLHLLCGALAFEYQNRQKGEVDLSERIMCYGRLIEYMEGMGANADIRNNDGQTPLELLPRDVRKTIEQQLLTKDTLEQDIDIYDR